MTDTTSPPQITTAGPGDLPPRRRGRVLGAWVFVIGVLLLAGWGVTFQSKLSSVQKNDNTSFLPASAESTKVNDEAQAFFKIQSAPGFVVFHRESGLTGEDKGRIEQISEAVTTIPGIDRTSPLSGQYQYSADGTAAALYAPLVLNENGKTLGEDQLKATQHRIIATATTMAGGLKTYPAGPAGIFGALIDIVSGLDGTLLLCTFSVVLLILLVVYRSPVLWIFPLAAAAIALALSILTVYWLARAGVVTLTGMSEGILFVLVMGAGTDYALLLISRYREELHRFESRFDAMWSAWKQAFPPIVASAVTVMIGAMCLMFSALNSNKGLGPVAVVGVASTLLVMMTVLPLTLAAIGGRWAFWPRVPRFDHTVDPAEMHGVWGRVAGFLGRRHRAAWLTTTAVLFLGLLGISSLNTNGLSIEDGFTNRPAAIIGTDILTAKFVQTQGTGEPAQIMVNADKASQLMAAVAKVPGVSEAPGSVCEQIDVVKLTSRPFAMANMNGGPNGCPAPDLVAAPINGRTMVNVTLASAFDSKAAIDTVRHLRSVAHAIPGAHALVGGPTATTFDTHEAAVRDNKVIIPIVLVVIFLVLALLLRALVAPVLLIASVVLSFAATLGVCGFMFAHVFHFGGTDQSFPLFVFVFLVALGIDYNIFLMTRVREETRDVGTRSGILRGLAVTGGVITSAGAVLAATFAILGVVTLVFFVEVGFAVAFGVLLDTLLVRTLLVPALAFDLGKRIWWPSGLARGRD
jgi:RND superfamily putative drug exporter